MEYKVGMKRYSKTQSIVRVAVPCYGERVFPRFGQARVFCFAEIDPSGKTPHRLQLRLWPSSQEPQVAHWLRDQGIGGVLCGGIHPRYQAALGSQGIWVVWGVRGEVGAILQEWVEAFASSEPQPWSGFSAMR